MTPDLGKNRVINISESNRMKNNKIVNNSLQITTYCVTNFKL